MSTLNNFKVGCLINVFSSYISSHEDDLSHCTYFMSTKRYKDILSFHYTGNFIDRKTIEMYFFYILLWGHPSVDVISYNLSKFEVGKRLKGVMPPNLIDHHICPISSDKLDVIYHNIIIAISRYTFKKPNITFQKFHTDESYDKLTNHHFYREIYRQRSNSKTSVWSNWIIQNKNPIPTKGSHFLEFIKMLNKYTEWTAQGLLNFLFNQTTLPPILAHLLAESENGKDAISVAIFIVLRTQRITDITLKYITELYENVHMIIEYVKIEYDYLYPVGYKSIYAFTQSDLNINGQRQLLNNILELRGKYKVTLDIFKNISVVQYSDVSDIYENNLLKIVTEYKLTELPSNIHSKYMRKAAKEYGDEYHFLLRVLRNSNMV